MATPDPGACHAMMEPTQERIIETQCWHSSADNDNWTEQQTLADEANFEKISEITWDTMQVTVKPEGRTQTGKEKNKLDAERSPKNWKRSRNNSNKH